LPQADCRFAEAMTDEDASKPWQQHTAQLMSRVIAVSATTFEFLHDHLDTLPQPPLAVQLSDRAALKYQLGSRGDWRPQNRAGDRLLLDRFPPCAPRSASPGDP
jgi:hypothetical protein